MKKDQKGVMIRSISPTSDAYKRLKENDIIVKFDGIQIACDGSVPFRSARRPSSTPLKGMCRLWVLILLSSLLLMTYNSCEDVRLCIM